MRQTISDKEKRNPRATEIEAVFYDEKDELTGYMATETFTEALRFGKEIKAHRVEWII